VYEIWACLACGFQWVRPTPDEQMLSAYYAGGIDAEYVNYVRAAETKKEHFRQKFVELEAHLPAPSRLLDVGCASGFLLEVALELGWQPRGVELNPGFATSTARSLDGCISYGRLRDVAPATLGRPCLITLFDVIEHTPTSRADLACCRDLLAPGGAMVVQLPCIDALARRALGRHWYHYAPPAHINYFSAKTFGKLVASLGLRVVHQTWTRKLMNVDYFTAQVAASLGLSSPPSLGAIGKTLLRVPMSERLFVLRKTSS
jgi:SAM-dependent methyltransferase